MAVPRRRRGPPRNALVRNDAHGIRDRDVNDALRLIDPTGAVQAPHFLRSGMPACPARGSAAGAAQDTPEAAP